LLLPADVTVTVRAAGAPGPVRLLLVRKHPLPVPPALREN
jgi:hypothetical protein